MDLNYSILDTDHSVMISTVGPAAALSGNACGLLRSCRSTNALWTHPPEEKRAGYGASPPPLQCGVQQRCPQILPKISCAVWAKVTYPVRAFHITNRVANNSMYGKWCLRIWVIICLVTYSRFTAVAPSTAASSIQSSCGLETLLLCIGPFAMKKYQKDLRSPLWHFIIKSLSLSICAAFSGICSLRKEWSFKSGDLHSSARLEVRWSSIAMEKLSL